MPFDVSRAALAVAACLALAACGSFDSATHRIADSITPYKVEIVQGNFVSREQVNALKPGMSRSQVRDILGTPLITDAFHRERWDYVFTIRRQGVPPQEHKLAVYFKGDEFEKAEGDQMPTESEFVATLDNRRKGAAIPPLEASEDKLKQFSADNKPPAAPSAPQEGPASMNYPPLEPAR